MVVSVSVQFIKCTENQLIYEELVSDRHIIRVRMQQWNSVPPYFFLISISHCLTLYIQINQIKKVLKSKLETYGERAFSVAAPRLRNKLPFQVRLSSSETVFKTNLKTHLFKRAFDL